MNRRAAVTVALVLVLGGCSDTDGDGDADLDPVEAAQQRVDRAEEDLAEANAAVEDANSRFCDDSTAFVDVLDGYAGILTDDEATVGVVQLAGDDLDEPRDTLAASVEDVQVTVRVIVPSGFLGPQSADRRMESAGVDV